LAASAENESRGLAGGKDSRFNGAYAKRSVYPREIRQGELDRHFRRTAQKIPNREEVKLDLAQGFFWGLLLLLGMKRRLLRLQICDR
jgi:hypothetical protein